MTKSLLAILLFASVIVLAQTPGANLGYTDTPMLPGLPYHVHDPSRPRPTVITPGAQTGAAPSDAIGLFTGADLSQWTTTKQSWKVENGYVEVVPNAGDIRTKEKFGDVQLHVEWAAPAVVRGTSQNRGNSGIFLQGRYEVQVLDSFENPTYADGQAGAIYGQWPPLVNPVRKPGEWQTYDIVFEAPRIEGRQGREARVSDRLPQRCPVASPQGSHGADRSPRARRTRRSRPRTHWSCRIISSRCGPQYLDSSARRLRPAPVERGL